MTEIALPGFGPPPIEAPSGLVTCCYADLKRLRGRVAGVGTSVGRPRYPMKGVIGFLKEAEPHGAFPKWNNDRARYEEVYRARLDKHVHSIKASLELFHEQASTEHGIDGPLALLCWCKLDRPGHPQNWCHRHMLAEWMRETYGFVIPEVHDHP
jgi:hypothetical protein